MRILSTAAIALFMLALPAAARDLPQSLPTSLVYLRDVAPAIAQDMRYAGPDNMTGHALPGYAAGECVLRREVAAALSGVAADLARQNLNLKVYDCYRPARAVHALWRWAHDARSGGETRFYPRTPKRELFARGYIASRSRHSTGTAVDLTLVARPPRPVPAYVAGASYGPCTAPADKRAPDNSLDMGTGFDCLDPKSHTRSGQVTPAQSRNRERLRAAMAAHGFRNYFREWWHYEFRGAPQHTYDVPIGPRHSSSTSP